MSKYFVISYAYAGPNRGESEMDYDHFVISKIPAKKNLSGEIIETGWAGTTNDISTTAHGCFETVEEAKKEIGKILGEDMRDVTEEAKEEHESVFDDTEGSVVAAFKAGMSEEAV